MIPVITSSDLKLVNYLSDREYSGNSLKSNSSEAERDHLTVVKEKLKTIASFFAQKYNEDYGPFESSVVTGNDIVRSSKYIRRIWSGIYKGAANKQYSAQISFVINPKEPSIDVGFYFGRASGHTVNGEKKILLEKQLGNLGLQISNALRSNRVLKDRFEKLFDIGFKAVSDNKKMLSDEWIQAIAVNPKNSQVIATLSPNDFGVIETSTMDYYISQVMYLMDCIGEVKNVSTSKALKPLTAEQRAKQAERMTIIGEKGEEFVLNSERIRTASYNKNPKYPYQTSKDSMISGYDILSVDQDMSEVFIEVKTTTRLKKDPLSRMFFISNIEFNLFQQKSKQFRLVRVYDIEGNPESEIIDLTTAVTKSDGFVVHY